MSEIFLTEEQYKTLPYKHTTVSRATTYGDIIELLENHAIKNYNYLRVNDQEVLSFPIVVVKNTVKIGLIVKFTIPKLYYNLPISKGKNAKRSMTYLEKESWRVFWWHLKSKLEAIQYGISDELTEFMSNILYKLPDGQGNEKEVSIKDNILSNLEQLPKLISIKQNQLEAKS